jgi:hypothetical protein
MSDCLPPDEPKCCLSAKHGKISAPDKHNMFDIITKNCSLDKLFKKIFCVYTVFFVYNTFKKHKRTVGDFPTVQEWASAPQERTFLSSQSRKIFALVYVWGELAPNGARSPVSFRELFTFLFRYVIPIMLGNS